MIVPCLRIRTRAMLSTRKPSSWATSSRTARPTRTTKVGAGPVPRTTSTSPGADLPLPPPHTRSRVVSMWCSHPIWGCNFRPEVRAWWATKFSFTNYQGSTPALYTWNDMNEVQPACGPSPLPVAFTTSSSSSSHLTTALLVHSPPCSTDPKCRCTRMPFTASTTRSGSTGTCTTSTDSTT